MHNTTMRDQLSAILRAQEPKSRLAEPEAWNAAAAMNANMAQGYVRKYDCGLDRRPSRYDRRRIARQARALEVSR